MIRGTRGTGAALSHGGCPEQKSRGEKARAGCCGALAASRHDPGKKGSGGPPRPSWGASLPPEQCPWEGSQSTQCHLKEGLSVQT